MKGVVLAGIILYCGVIIGLVGCAVYAAFWRNDWFAGWLLLAVANIALAGLPKS